MVFFLSWRYTNVKTQILKWCHLLSLVPKLHPFCVSFIRGRSYFNWINEEIWLQSFSFFVCLSFIAGKSTKTERLSLICHRNPTNQFGSWKENIRKKRELTTGSRQLFLPCFATSKMKKKSKVNKSEWSLFLLFTWNDALSKRKNKLTACISEVD